MKKTFSLILLYPLALFGQQSNCELNIKIADLKSPAVLYMRVGTHTDTLRTSTGQATWTKELDHPVQGVLTIDYAGYKRSDYQPLFLTSGRISLSLSNPAEPYLATINGPNETTSYQNDLWKPVSRQNEIITDLRRVYTGAVNSRSSDTLARHTVIFDAIKRCFDIPRQYIRSHSNSLVSIEALKYMGDGDPTNPDKLTELKALYDSLSPAVRESAEGILYQNKLNIKLSRQPK